jgi:hypothetical protein
MPTSKTDRLPARPDLEWLRKRAKAMLAELRRARSDARLADAQRAVARRYGFASWRALKAHVDGVRARAAAPEPQPEDTVARFLRLVGNGDRDGAAAMLSDAPALVNAVGPHPFWGGRPQPLHVAIETRRFEMVQLLLRAGADVNGSNDPLLRDDEHRETPAGWAEVALRVTNNPRCAEVAARLRRAEADARG